MRLPRPEESARRRHRGLYAAWVAAVVGCGLGSRSEALALPPFAAKYAGDALWAAMVFLGVGFLRPARGTAAVAGLAAAVCVAVECSQLYHAPWIDVVRRTWVGRVALGTTFGWGDLAAYLVGIAAGAAAEVAAGLACRPISARVGPAPRRPDPSPASPGLDDSLPRGFEKRSEDTGGCS